MRAPIAHIKRSIIAAAIAAWFLGHAWKGLFFYFQGDDMMNIYNAWVLPPWKLLLANLTPFSTIYRPLGTAVYRVLFATFGWHPLGFRIVVYALILLNTWLVYRVARLVSGSAEIAVLAAFLVSYHQRLMDLYIGNGTMYDVLCCTFFLLALISYLTSRPLLFLLCYVLALNAKEMAATLPLVLLVYDWCSHRPLGSRVLWASLVMTVIAFFMKTSSASAFANVPDYHLNVTVHEFFAVTRPELAHVFFLPDNALNTFKTVTIFVLVWAVAAVTRRKSLLFAAAFVTLTPLPISFIPYRGFFVMYLPLVGWAIWLATVLVEGRDWLWKAVWQRPALPEDRWEPERIGLFLLVAYVLFVVQLHDLRSFDQVDPSQERIRTLKEALVVRPNLRPNGRVLLLHDPFPREYYEPAFVLLLNYHSTALTVHRDEPKDQEPYDLILDYDGHAYHELTVRP